MGSETVMDLDTSVLCKAPTQKVLFAAMSRQLKSLGIHAVVIRDLCEMSRNRFQEVTAIYTTYPEHIRDKYREHNCLPIDPFLRTALSSLKPARLTEYLATNEVEGPLASVLADLRKRCYLWRLRYAWRCIPRDRPFVNR
ncbi:MAG: autoinducer binding domain-containing protein, partial [Pseudomonadota bacterium]